MPVYEYACRRCGGFQVSRPIAEAAMQQPCPACDRPAPRALAAPHVRGPRAAVHYLAGERNERSANEPGIEHRLNGAGGNARAASAPDAYRHAGHAHRPWMIGH